MNKNLILELDGALTHVEKVMSAGCKQGFFASLKSAIY